MNMRFFSAAIAVTSFLAVTAQGQTPTTITNATYGVIRSGAANASIDIDEAAAGYVMVKYTAPPCTASSNAKGYFMFDLTGKSRNTNATATFTFDRYYNSEGQGVRFWALKQAVTNTTLTNIIYNFAALENGNTQLANELPSNNLRTNSAPTATLLDEAYVPASGGGTPPYSFTVPAPWGQYVFNNKLVLVLTGNEAGTSNGAAGMRVSLDASRSSASGATNPPPTLTFYSVVGNPPSMSAIGNLITTNGIQTGTNSFTVSDPEDAASLLILSATSSDETIIAATNVFFGGNGNGTNRNVSVLPHGAGTAKITVTATDTKNNLAQRVFTVTVIPANYPPVVSKPGNTSMLNTAGSVVVPFTVSDVETPAGSLIVTGRVSSLSGAVLSSVTFGGSGGNRTATVTPQPGGSGVGIVHVDVSDLNNNTTRVSFAVHVLPSTSILFNDYFDYENTAGNNYGVLKEGSANFWTNRTSGSANLRTTNSTALIRPSNSGESLVATLVGAPVESGLLYFSCKATWLAEATNSSGEFLSLWPESAGPDIRVAKVYTAVGSAPGFFRLRICNMSGPEVHTNDLAYNVPHTIVVRYNVSGPDDEPARLWVDPASEADYSVQATDFIGVAVPPITHICLRQYGGMGTIMLDNLKVGTSFEEVLPPTVDPVVAAFTASPTSGVAPLTVTFTDTSTGPITSRFWDFGDGVTSNATVTTVLHTYSVPAAYQARLVVSGQSNSSTNQTTITVMSQPIITGAAVTNLPGGDAMGLYFTADPAAPPTAFTVVGSTNLFTQGVTNPVSGAIIESLGAGSFRAVVPISGSQLFYRIRQQ